MASCQASYRTLDKGHNSRKLFFREILTSFQKTENVAARRI